MPRGRERPSLRLAVSHHDSDNEIRVIERRAVAVRNRIAELTAFMNRAGRFRRAVRTDSTRKRKLPEKLEKPSFVAALIRIDLRVVAFEIAVSKRGRRAMTGPGDGDHI